MTTTLSAAVIGAGSMGRNHARIYADFSDVRLAAIVDSNAETAKSIANKYGAAFYTDIETMLSEQNPDVVSIAVPTSLHAEVAKKVLQHKSNVLIEKPIAASSQEAEILLREAKKANVLFMVGHVERFNPAVQEVKRRLQNKELGALHYIEARRQGPFPSRINDAGVVIDLAVHDLDVISFITDAKLKYLYADTKQCLHEKEEDILSAILHYENNIIANVSTNWITATKIREMFVTGEAGTFHVNYLTQDVTYYENAMEHSSDWEAMGIWRGVSEGNTIRYHIQKEEPLKRELRAFVEAVKCNGDSPMTGQDALNVLYTAEKILLSGKEKKVIFFE